MEIDLSTNTYVVTGATSGIGLAVAEALLSGGSAVIGVGRSPQRCREAEQRLQQKYPVCTGKLPCCRPGRTARSETPGRTDPGPAFLAGK